MANLTISGLSNSLSLFEAINAPTNEVVVLAALAALDQGILNQHSDIHLKRDFASTPLIPDEGEVSDSYRVRRLKHVNSTPQSSSTSLTDSDTPKNRAINTEIPSSYDYPPYQIFNTEGVYRLNVVMGDDVLPHPEDVTLEEFQTERQKYKTTRDLSRVYIEDLYNMTYDISKLYSRVDDAYSISEIQSLMCRQEESVREILQKHHIPQSNTLYIHLDRIKDGRCSLHQAKEDSRVVLDFLSVYHHAQDKLVTLNTLVKRIKEISKEIMENRLLTDSKPQKITFRTISKKAKCVVSPQLGSLTLKNYKRAHILPLSSFEIIMSSKMPLEQLNPLRIKSFNRTIECLDKYNNPIKVPMYAFLNKSQLLNNEAEEINISLEDNLRGKIIHNFNRILSNFEATENTVEDFRRAALKHIEGLNNLEFGHYNLIAFTAGLKDIQPV